MSLTALTKLLQPIRNRIANMIARSVIQLVNDGAKMQLVQLSVLDGETRDAIERVQNYGFTSVPLAGAEAVVLFLDGRRDHGLAVAVDDRRHRKTGLQPGEVALYHKDGAIVLLKADGSIEVKSTTKVVVDSPAVELAQPATDAALKGAPYSTALGTFITALNTYTAAIKAIADPPGVATTTFTTAASAFATATSGALSAKVKIG